MSTLERYYGDYGAAVSSKNSYVKFLRIDGEFLRENGEAYEQQRLCIAFEMMDDVLRSLSRQLEAMR